MVTSTGNADAFCSYVSTTNVWVVSNAVNKTSCTTRVTRCSAADCMAKWSQVVAARDAKVQTVLSGLKARDDSDMATAMENVKSEEGRKKKRNETDQTSKARALVDASACASDPTRARHAPSLRAMVVSAALRCGSTRKHGDKTAPIDILLEVAKTWGPIFSEPGHAEYSWRVKGLKGVVEGKGVVEEVSDW